MNTAIESLIEELEQDHSLQDADRLRQRIEVMDRLDAHLLDMPASGTDSAELRQRAEAIYTGLETANLDLYEAIRSEIRQTGRPDRLLRILARSSPDWSVSSLPSGDGYDYLDDLTSGILQFQMPGAPLVELTAEMVAYQPTPARHVFGLIHRVQFTGEDVLIDLGAGLGHVPLLASICTGVSSIGIELEGSYVDSARKSAEALNLQAAKFIQQDVRKADLSVGTVFYLYTPFTGTILRTVLDSLKQQAARRRIRVCTFGPCTPTVAQEPWLEIPEPLEVDRVAIFSSRS